MTGLKFTTGFTIYEITVAQVLEAILFLEKNIIRSQWTGDLRATIVARKTTVTIHFGDKVHVFLAHLDPSDVDYLVEELGFPTTFIASGKVTSVVQVIGFDFPEEILLEQLSYLTPPVLLALRNVSSYFRELLAPDSYYWQGKYKEWKEESGFLKLDVEYGKQMGAKDWNLAPEMAIERSDTWIRYSTKYD